MGNKKPVRHLCIFLMKDGAKNVDDIVDASKCQSVVKIPISGHGTATLFVKMMPAKAPKWASLFKDHINPSTLAVKGVSAALALKVGTRFFVLTFGHGRFLLRDGVWEERFGLLSALNSVDRSTYRCVDVQSLDAIQSHSRIQSGQEATPDQFGLDVEQDMLKAIVGTPTDASLGSRMTGSDSLSVSIRMDLSDLPGLLEKYRVKFETDLKATDHDWVNNISLVKTSDLVSALENRLIEKLNGNDTDGLWLSIPEIIDWTTVVGFVFDRGKGIVRTDITLAGFSETLKSGEVVVMDTLKGRHVHCVDADHNRVFQSWSVYRCLYAELDFEKRKYILNDGKWFAVADDFVERADAQFAAIPKSTLKLPVYSGGGEGKYNSDVAAGDPAAFDLLDDKKKVMHGGSHGQVEICDLLHISRQLIHVKLYGKSSVLSHLVAQGFVSGQLIQIDPEFRKKVRAKLSPTFSDLLADDKRPAQDEFTIVYAVVSSAPGELHLPFFSRVNLNNTAKVLRGLGYKVELLKIDVDDSYAKTVKVPPGKKAGKAQKKP